MGSLEDRNGQTADRSDLNRSVLATRAASSAPKRRPIWVWWTAGKDAAWVLRLLRSDSKWDVRGLLAAVTIEDGRSWLHGVRRDLLAKQATAVRLPLRTIEVDPRADPPRYDAAVRSVCGELRSEGTAFVAFADLFSSRRRRRRVQLLQGTGLEAVFPLWGEPTRTPPDRSERLRRVRGHVAENLSGDLRIARVAAVAGLAPSSFRRFFRRHMGMTYGAWLTRRRMEMAARLLREGESDLAAVGRTVGYPVDRSFRRAFRGLVGCSPSRYRELCRAGRLPDRSSASGAPGSGVDGKLPGPSSANRRR